jgi:hypothetical protein
MSGHQFTLLVPASAREAHQQLVSALGTENVPGQWMIFMEAVTRLLPDVLSSGRPPKEAIARCAIGQLGFTSWKAMIEAPTVDGGLGWNWSAWRAWRRAWTVVQAYPWLRAAQMTASEIYTLSQDCKRDEMSFPASRQELEAAQAARKNVQEQRRADSVAALQERVATAEAAADGLRQQLAAATARGALLAEQLAIAQTQVQAQARADELAAQVGQQKEQIEELKRQLAAAKKTQPNPMEPARMTRWEHLLAALTGRP